MSKSIPERIPQFIRELEPYIPGRPIEEVEREIGASAVKLASNENPLGPSPLAMAAARIALSDANRYPDGGGQYLRRALAERLAVPIDNVILGAGSTELIDLTARAMLHIGESAVVPEGSFPLFYISTRASGAHLVKVPLRDYAYDLDAVARAVFPGTKLVFLANPNNPTGSMFTADEFDAFLGRIPEDVMVVLDEAYFEYVEAPNYSRALEYVRERRNVIVLRTFSKVYGLAGLRIGYGLGPVELLEQMNKLRSPFNTSNVAQAAALAALDDAEHVRRSVESNRVGLVQLTRGLLDLGVRVLPSVGNFVLIEMGDAARRINAEVLQSGVIVRPMGWMGFPEAIRVTVGSAEENEKFLLSLARVLAPSGEAAPMAVAEAHRGARERA